MTIDWDAMLVTYRREHKPGCFSVRDMIEHCYNVLSLSPKTGNPSTYRAGNILLVSNMTLLNEMKRFGINRGQRFGRKVIPTYVRKFLEYDEKQRLVKSGAEMAKEFGCSPNYITWLRRRYRQGKYAQYEKMLSMELNYEK